MTAVQPRALDLRLEYEHADHVPVSRPRLSWKTETDAPAWTQSFADVEWTSADDVRVARVDGAESVFVEWPFEALNAGQRGTIRVRTAGSDGEPGPWSEPRAVRAGFLDEGAWRAAFVELEAPSRRAEPFLVRAEFDVRSGLESATLFATAQGVYQAEINGHVVDDQILKPGWTPYATRLIHESTDVTSHVRVGRNSVGASVAGGWFTEVYGFRAGAAPFYGEQPAVALQLELRYSDGAVEIVSSDASWRTHSGPIVSSGIYAGESFDARERVEGWSEAGLDDTNWMPARERVVTVVPSARTSPIVTEIERVPVAEVLRAIDGSVLLDFGQNLVGWLEIIVVGTAGHEVTLRHAEVLEHGELGVRPLRRADATDRYKLSGGAEETWHPLFTFHGFRYVEIANWPGEFDPSSVTAVVVHSRMPRTGWFDSSSTLLNRLHENVVWGMRGNFLYLPMDCPQRDERLGWTGDIQVFAPTASFLFESNGFLASWLEDLAIEQKAIGGVPFIVPNVLESARLPTAVWGDAATIVPWALYERFGDVGVLSAQFDSMRAWVDQVLELAGPRRLWEGGFQFGDWLDPTAPADRPGDARTDPDLVASAYLYRSLGIVADAAKVIGRDELAARYSALATEVLTAWRAEYVTPSGRLMSDAETAYALGIVFGLIPENQHEIAGARLAELVRRSGYRIATGFVGTPLIQDALSVTGQGDVAARLLMQTENPSWLYPVTMGATTIWERWDSLLPDGTVNPGEMTSFNHYALGAVADWMHRVLAGLAPATPGYRSISIAPRPLIGFDHAHAEHETPYGPTSSEWRAESGDIVVRAVIPPNTTAVVDLPDGSSTSVGSGTHEWRVADTRAVVTVSSDLGLGTPLAQLIDDREAYATVLDAIRSVDPEIAETFKKTTRWTVAQTLASSTIDTPSTVFDALTTALNELNAIRRG